MYKIIENNYKSYYTNTKQKLRKSTVLQRNPNQGGSGEGVRFTNLSY